MGKKRVVITVVVAVICFVALAIVDQTRPFLYSRMRNLYRDTITRAGRRTAPNPNLVFLAIDSDSVGLDLNADIQDLYGLSANDSEEAHALGLMSKLWPWPREIYGLILERLVKAGAKVVMFDLTFPTPTDGDAPFRMQLDRYKDHVVIGSNFVSANSRGFTTIGASHTRPPESLIPQTTPMDDRVAYTNFWPDEDDIVRRAQYRVTFNQVEGIEAKAESEQFLSLGARALTKAGYGSVVPTDLNDRVFRYTAPGHEGFPARSVFEIFVPEYWKHNYRGGEFFRDKIVIIGAEGNWQHDEHPTPFGSMPGPEVHLNAINAALQHEFINEMPAGSPLLLAFIAGAMAIAISMLVRSPWIRLPIVAVADAGCWLASVYIFDHASLFIPGVAPLIELNVTVMLGLISDFASERLDKARVRRTFERYVSHDVVRQMLDNPTAYAASLGGVLKPATILFSDIRGYSEVTMRSDPHVLVTQLNEYLTAMVECVFRFGGTLDKFIGDAVMAVWGNVRTNGVAADATAAVHAALAMHAELIRLNAKWRAAGLPELRVGIAVHHGEVVVGNIGSPQRMEFTVIGGAVNVSWKLQELTKDVGCELVVSKAVAAVVIEHFEMRSIGQFAIRGFANPFEVFSVSRAIAPSTEEAYTTLPTRSGKLS